MEPLIAVNIPRNSTCTSKDWEECMAECRALKVFHGLNHKITKCCYLKYKYNKYEYKYKYCYIKYKYNKYKYK